MTKPAGDFSLPAPNHGAVHGSVELGDSASLPTLSFHGLGMTIRSKLARLSLTFKLRSKPDSSDSRASAEARRKSGAPGSAEVDYPSTVGSSHSKDAGTSIDRLPTIIHETSESPTSPAPPHPILSRISANEALTAEDEPEFQEPGSPGPDARPNDVEGSEDGAPDPELSPIAFVFDAGGNMGRVPHSSRLETDSTVEEELSFDSDQDSAVKLALDISLIESRDRLTDPQFSDNANCLNYFNSCKPTEFWSVDLRLTLLWCLAYEARFRRRRPALNLLVAIIGGHRDRVDWGMWEDGDEDWLRRMVTEHRMVGHFRVTASKLSASDWMLARDALEGRIGRPRPPNPLKTWSTSRRVLRIAWCAVTDGIPMNGAGFNNLKAIIDSWAHFTAPFRFSNGQDVNSGTHDSPHCRLSSCETALWQWFETAIVDYDVDRIRDILGCCQNCVSRALSSVGVSNPVEPPIWPVILWVAFQVQATKSEPRAFDDFVALVDSNAPPYLGLWSWNDTHEGILRESLLANAPSSFWGDQYPSSWRKYIDTLDTAAWLRLEALTRRASFPQLQLEPLAYDMAIRIGAIVLWCSSASHVTAESPDLDTLLTFEKFLPRDRFFDGVGFMECLLERRAPLRSSFYELDLGPETVDWRHPRRWLSTSKEQLLSSVIQDPEAVSLLHVAENAYMVHHLKRTLPLRFMATVFGSLLRLKQRKSLLADFRRWIHTLKTWDTMSCLINFRWVLSHTLKFSKSIKEEDLPKSVINVVLHTDILCVCAQIAAIISDPVKYEEFLKTRGTEAQKLLDLIQDLLDYPLLHKAVRPIIMKALLKLSAKSGLHPRCFALEERLQLDGQQVAAGSFGDVWKGLIRGEVVSVKVMRVYQEDDVEALLKEFYREALIWRQLSHPNLLPFFGAYYLKGSRSQLCLVSPWMDHGNIARYLKKHPAGMDKRLSLIVDVSLGLEHLHGMKVVHGDLKAINVLVTRSGRAVLADFGLSSVIDSKIFSSTTNLKTGGTVRWQAPELFTGGRNSFASDIYAFSFVCYEILTGTLPFYELTKDVAVMFRVMAGERPSRPLEVSDGVWSLMEDCWQEDPTTRPFADQVVFRLRDRPISAVPTIAASEWDPWYTSKFRSSLEEHTLFLSCGTLEDWIQFTQANGYSEIQNAHPLLSARSALSLDSEDSSRTTAG